MDSIQQWETSLSLNQWMFPSMMRTNNNNNSGNNSKNCGSSNNNNNNKCFSSNNKPNFRLEYHHKLNNLIKEEGQKIVKDVTPTEVDKTKINDHHPNLETTTKIVASPTLEETLHLDNPTMIGTTDQKGIHHLVEHTLINGMVLKIRVEILTEETPPIQEEMILTDETIPDNEIRPPKEETNPMETGPEILQTQGDLKHQLMIQHSQQ